MLLRKLIAGEHAALTVFIQFVLLSWRGGRQRALWIEGERYVSSSFNRHGWYQNTNIGKELLSPGTPGVSEGAWHAHYTSNGSEQASAMYRFTIAEGGTYSWWIRLNPFRNSNGGGNYSYRYRQRRRVDGLAEPSTSPRRSDQMIDLVEPGIDIRFIAWCYGGSFDLVPGSYELEVRLSRREGDDDNHGGIDVMALVNFPWAPTGMVPPDTNVPAPDPDTGSPSWPDPIRSPPIRSSI